MEKWKDIKGFEGYYQVSDLGRIKSLDRYIEYKDGRTFFYKGKIKTQQYNKRFGYNFIKLYKDSKCYTWRINRLVAMHFINNPEKKPLVHHKNKIKIDDRAINLEWVRHNEHKKLYHPSVRRKKIICVETNQEFDGSYLAAVWINNSKFNCTKNPTNMSKLIRRVVNKKNMAYGFHFIGK